MAALLVVLVALFFGIPNWSGAITFWAEPLQEIGGPIAMIASIVTSHYFVPAIIVAAILYLIFVKHPENLVVRHRWWAAVSWVVFGTISVMMLVVCVAGYVATAVGPRHLYKNQQAIIESSTTSVEPPYKISIEYDMTCPDCGNYARALERAFGENKDWVVADSGTIAGPSPNLLSETGISVFSYTESAEILLTGELSAAHIPYELKNAPNDPFNPSDITILVSEPEGPQ